MRVKIDDKTWRVQDAAQAVVKKGITTAATSTGKKDEVKTTITKAKTKAGI